MARVFLAGASGVLGRKLIPLLIADGHQVIGLVRTEPKARLLEALGAKPVQGSLFDGEGLSKLAEGCDVVVHGATAIPKMRIRTRAKDWQMNDRIRRTGTGALLECARNIGAKQFLQQSITWVAKPDDGSYYDEESPTNPNWLTASMLDGEEMARTAAEKFGFACTILRCGGFYGAEANHTVDMAEKLKARQLPIAGEGRATWTMLHLDDVASAFAAAIKRPRDGLFHVVDDEPVMIRDFFGYFAERLEAKPPRHVPLWATKWVVGDYNYDYLSISSRTSNQKFKRTFEWRPRFPNYKTGIDHVVEQLKEIRVR